MSRTTARWLCMGLGVCATCAGLGEDAMPETLTNSIGMTLVRIEPGRFEMGQAEGGDFDERPVHTVTITKPFHMASTEVTNAQYEQFDPAHRDLRGKRGLSKDDDEAVVFVSWHEAVAFCEWLSQKEGKPCRLPTEAEWEYACRAGTTTPFHTGDELPEPHLKHPKTEWDAVRLPLHVGQTPPNAWGLHDMHGNVEEWCLDGYGPYVDAGQTDPVGRSDADFKVTRGGSANTEPEFLRAANRLATLPEDKHWLIGFRVVQAPMPETRPLSKPPREPWARDVSQSAYKWSDGPDPDEPYFRGPRVYVKVPPDSNGPLYSHHNPCPALTACPNGDLLAIWYTTRTEPGRELAIAASRLRRGADEWEPASPFWDTPDRNDHASALLWSGDTLYHLNGMSSDATWGKLALIMRTSTDNGATWSKARIVKVEHTLRNMPIAGVFETQEGWFVLPCDAVTGGHGGTAVHISRDRGYTWVDPGAGKPTPTFKNGETGAWIAGIHAGVTQLEYGSLLAFGRGNAIDGRMPMSRSEDMGETWTYAPSPFPPISGGQRLVLKRLIEGPLMVASFAKELAVTDAAGVERTVSGLFTAVSYDSAQTWTAYRLVTDDGPPRPMDGGGNTGPFTLGPDTAEPRGYLACVQTPDRVIHLISSKQHYAFNLKWLETAMPAANGG